MSDGSRADEAIHDDWLEADRLAAVFGCAGTALTGPERALFAASRPLGFILFARNCVSPGQVIALIDDLRACVGDPYAPVLIDQEGGRVQRLKPPEWHQAPPARLIGDLWLQNRAAGREAATLIARLVAADLAALGITVNCAPVADIAVPDTHVAIGDRAFGGDQEQVTELARAVCVGLEAGGVTPVIKHLPGHGRAAVDSHATLPRIVVDRATLARVDFAPFRALRATPWGLVGHLVLDAVDPEFPASQSHTVIAEIIRGAIGFDGVLISDDINMGALSGDIGQRARAVVAAGCDLAAHCSGVLNEMEQVVDALGPLTTAARARLLRAERRRMSGRGLDIEQTSAWTRLRHLLGEVAA